MGVEKGPSPICSLLVLALTDRTPSIEGSEGDGCDVIEVRPLSSEDAVTTA